MNAIQYLSLMVLCVIMAGCGSGGDNQVTEEIPVAPPVTESIEMEWTDMSAQGGYVEQVARSDSMVFAASEGVIWRYSTSSTWARTTAKGNQIIELPDGSLITNRGFRLTPGASEWIDLEFEGELRISPDGTRLFRIDADRVQIFVSDDAGQTWSTFVTAPAPVRAVTAVEDGMVFVVDPDVTMDREVWHYRSSASRWEGPLFTGDANTLAAHNNGTLFVFGNNSSHWNDGGEWRVLEYAGQDVANVNVVGRAAAGEPLIASADRVFRVTDTATLEPFIEFPDAFYINHVYLDADGGRMLASANGMWAQGAGASGFSQIGLPGDHVSHTHYLDRAYYSSLSPSAGIAFWARFDELDQQWKRVALGQNHVRSAVLLRNGEHLLGTANAFDGGYGDLFRWAGKTGIHWLLQAAPPVNSVAVNDRDEYFVAFGVGLEGKDYEVIVSPDGGASWETSPLDAQAQWQLAAFCGDVHAAGPDGFHSHDRSGWRQATEQSLRAPLNGLYASEQHMITFSNDRLWLKAGCDGHWAHVPLPQGTVSITTAVVDIIGNIWAVTNDGGIHLPPQADSWFDFDTGLSGEPVEISVGANDEIIVRVSGQGLWSGVSAGQ